MYGRAKYSETVISFAGADITRLEGNNHYSNGYFLEALLEGSGRLGPGEIGVFGKFTALHARGNFAITGGLGATATSEFDYNFFRQTWILGGKFTLPF